MLSQQPRSTQNQTDQHLLGFEQRLNDVRAIWQQNQWLYVMIGFLIGLLAVPAIQIMFNNFLELLENLVPEAFGIAFTVFLVDRLYSARDEKRRLTELQLRLLREIGGQSNEAAKQAADEIRHLGWLTPDNGLLVGANLSRAKLSSIDLRDANLNQSNLERTDLANANLEKAKMIEAYVDSANLSGCNLAHTDLTDANLSNSNLNKANLFRANLTRAKLLEANLSEAYLRHIRLDGAFLINANLQEADLRLAKLQSADLFNANLQSANLRGAILENTHLKGANLAGTILIGVTCNENTILPDGSNWKEQRDLSIFGAIVEEEK